MDSREITDARVLAWAEVLADVDDAFLRPAALDAVRAGAGYIDPQAIRQHAAPHLRRNARAVRSAQLRQLVPASWHSTRPLPAAVNAALAADWAAHNDEPEQLTATPIAARRRRGELTTAGHVIADALPAKEH